MKQALIAVLIGAAAVGAACTPPPSGGGGPWPPADGTCHADIYGNSVYIASHQGTTPQIWWLTTDVQAYSTGDCTGTPFAPGNPIVWGPSEAEALSNCTTNVGGSSVSEISQFPTLPGVFECIP